MQITELSPDDVKTMSYNQLIGLTRETNRPPGGINTLIRVAQMTFLKPGEKVLEIGTSTGFTAIELARLTNAHVYAIDINPQSLQEASSRAATFGVSELTTFKQDDATALSFKDDFFDMVFCGNVTSLVDDRNKALREYYRVLKPGKYLVSVPIYYVDKPSDSLIANVSAAIQVAISPHYRDYWLDFFKAEGLEQFFIEDYRFNHIAAEEVEAFVSDITARPHLASMSKEARETLIVKYRDYMRLFADNLAHMGFSILVQRKEISPMDRELFTAHKVTYTEG